MPVHPRSLLRAPGAGALVALACAALIVLGWAVVVERVNHERETAAGEAVRQNENLVLAYEQQTVRTLHGIDQALRFLRHEYQTQGGRIDLPKLLNTGALNTAIVRSATIIDARGKVILSSIAPGADVSDRPYFLAHRDDPSDRMRVSEPMTSRVDGRSVVLATRRIAAADGAFEGVAVVGVHPEYFADFAGSLRVGERGSIQLVGLDGVARVRRVGTVMAYGLDMEKTTLIERARATSSGSFLSRGTFEGYQRYTSFRTLRDYPFAVAIGTAVDEALTEFNVRRRNYYAGATAATAMIVLLGVLLALAMARHRDATAERRRADMRYRATFDEAPVGIAHQALDGRFLRVNRSLCAMLGYAEEELRGKTVYDVLHPEDAAAGWASAPRGDRAQESVFLRRLVRKDGSLLWGSCALSAVPGAHGQPEYLVAMVQDVTERKLAEQALEESRARFRDLVDNTSDFIWELDGGLRFVYASHNIGDLLGYSPEDLRGKRPFDLMPAQEAERVQAWFAPIFAAGRAFGGLETQVRNAKGETRIWETNGAPVTGPRGELLGYRGVSRDITQRKETEAALRRQAHYDALTGLPNRALCLDRLAQALTQARRRQWSTGLLFVDLDRFKNANDTLGHAAGDELLREAARRLLACVRAGDTVARIGGDEFAVVLSELKDPRDAAIVAEKVMDAMAAPLSAAGQELFLTASIGIAVCPPDGDDSEMLMRNADAAMSRAKRLGRNNFQFYAAEMNARAMDQLLLEADLRRALARGEFLLHFQPKADIGGERIVGFEALLRWNRGGERVVPPGEFIPLLEESGMIAPVGEWVIRSACAQLLAWREAGAEPVPVAVNVSAKQFHQGLFDIIERALRELALDPGLLEVEITESDAMHDPEIVIDVLRRLAALGVRASIDDFGTGYSSLGYLKRFPVHRIKLDRSFVSGLPGEADDVSITRAVISMAHSLGMEVVAEGVETEAQRRFLAAHRCDQMQGYLLARPLPAADCLQFLSAGAAA